MDTKIVSNDVAPNPKDMADDLRSPRDNYQLSPHNQTTLRDEETDTTSCKVLLVGVSEYEGQCIDLPFCKRDVSMMQSALNNGLNIPYHDITCLVGNISDREFDDAVDEFATKESDRKILYFTGHGDKPRTHFLVLSNQKCRSTKKTVNRLSQTCSSLVVILDCCYSGRAAEEQEIKERTASTADCGTGVIIASSSTAFEQSYPDPEGGVSVFTRCMYMSLNARVSKHRQYVSLTDVINLCQRLMERYNEHCLSSRKQRMLVKDDLSGPLLFGNRAYVPPAQRPILTGILPESGGAPFRAEPIHSKECRRYRTAIILNEDNDHDLVRCAHEVMRQIK